MLHRFCLVANRVAVSFVTQVLSCREPGGCEVCYTSSVL